MKEKNELRIEKDGSIALYKNDLPCFCYLQGVVYGQNQLTGESMPIRQSCNNCCPAFKIRVDKDKNTIVDITCMGIPVPYVVESDIKAEVPVIKLMKD